MRTLLERYRRLSATLARAIESLETFDSPFRPITENRAPVARIETATGDLEALLAFQERLAEVDGVTKVTIAGSTSERASFLVELADRLEASEAPQVQCTVCGRVISAGGQPPSHGVCEDCRGEFGRGFAPVP